MEQLWIVRLYERALRAYISIIVPEIDDNDAAVARARELLSASHDFVVQSVEPAP